MAIIINDDKLIYEKSRDGICNDYIKIDNSIKVEIPENIKRKEKAKLPEISELDLVRHYTNLSRKNFSVDTNFYPLGSCTMKYNSKALESVSEIENFNIHPINAYFEDLVNNCQGSLEILYELGELLSEITGMDSFSTHPMAGAHGEMTGIMIIQKYHQSKKNDHKRIIIVPDTSHGTNPASAAMAGYEIVSIPTANYGDLDIDRFKEAMNDNVAGVMMTCPNTLGLFNPYIKEISDIAHKYDALMYYDGANLNAIMGKVKPGDMGFDIIHVNVHKTFGTPHGGGGPGAGPVGVKSFLSQFLPLPLIKKENDRYFVINENDSSIGRVSNFFGNFLVLLKAYTYIKLLGKDGLKKTSEIAVLNANYIRSKLSKYFDLPYNKICMHECVFSLEKESHNKGVRAIDVAKYLIDNGIHPPTIYFPLIVKEALMIEPTETESLDTLNRFIDIMIEIKNLIETNPEKLKEAPVNTYISRVDETKAAKDMKVKYEG